MKTVWLLVLILQSGNSSMVAHELSGYTREQCENAGKIWANHKPRLPSSSALSYKCIPL